MDTRATTTVNPNHVVRIRSGGDGIEVIEGELEIIVIRELPRGEESWVEVIRKAAKKRKPHKH